MSTKKPLKPLHPDALRLMPAEDESMRCAEHTRTHAIDPVGTALDVDILVVADVPLPWPKPVFEHEALAGTTGMFMTPLGSVRLLASVPPQAGPRQIRMFARRGEATLASSVEWTAESDVLGLISRLQDGEAPDLEELDAPALLICTQGSHDVCCGSDGAKFASVVELTRPDITVLRVSHTGGHKFAPTAMSFPGGRMWANLDADLASGIIDQTVPAIEAAPHCRGWWGAASGPAQAAEREVFATVGWDWESTDRTVTEMANDDDTWVFRVRDDDLERDVAVWVERHLPTIACRADGGLPAKPAKEYRASILSPAKAPG